MFTDPISDMLTRIRNAQMVKKTEVFLPYSKLKLNILKILQKEGWIHAVEVIESTREKNKKTSNGSTAGFNSIKAVIIYENNQPKIKNLARISRPSRRVYVDKGNIPKVLNGYGLAVISTSKGLMTDKQARKEGIGGEVIFEIY
ncbi:MAG: 30S ribosomal protein S8 [Patescibacteria group bacterium]